MCGRALDRLVTGNNARRLACRGTRLVSLAWSEMARSVFESAPDGLVPPEQQIDRLNRVAPVHSGPRHPPQADVVASRMQATWPFFGACRLAGSEERSAAAERRSVFSPRSLSIFRPCRSSRQGAVLLGHGGVSLHGNAKHIPHGLCAPRGRTSRPPLHARRRGARFCVGAHGLCAQRGASWLSGAARNGSGRT